MENSESPCLVCHEAINIYAIGSCDHPICYKCSTRMRALCDQFYCPICRTDLPEVFFMQQLEKFGEMPVRKFISNKKLKIQFENNTIRDKTEIFLEHRCKICKDRYPEKSFKALQDHMRRQHTLFFCSLCVALKIFTSERKFYNRQALAVHRRLGDKDDKSYKGHPLCQFCDERYLDKDELYKHLRKDHYFCHFCEADGSQDFFNNYEVLRDHFETDHFLCVEGECADKQFENAFRSEIDIKGHRATYHSKASSKHQSRQERTINIDINLVPRPRVNRGRGAIGKEDYEELQPGSQGQSTGSHGRGAESRSNHRGGRGGESRRGRGNGREERDIERAMQASLSTMKDENVKRPQKDNSDKVDYKKDLFVHDEQSFPTLAGETATKSGGAAGENSANSNSKSSLADRFALSHNMSVQHGILAMSDFPTLNSDNNSASSVPTESQRPSVAAFRKPEGRRSPFTNAVANKRPEEDFPQLPVGKSKKIPSSQSASSWVKSGNPPVSSNNSSSQNRPIITFSKPKKSKNNKSDFFPQNKNAYDENDFPTLGNPSNTMADKWYSNGRDSPKTLKGSSSVNESATSSENSSEGYYIDRYSPVNIPDSPKLDSKSKSKKKKKKEKHDLPDKKAMVERKTDEHKDNSSLDNIASLLLTSSLQSEPNAPSGDAKTVEEDSSNDSYINKLDGHLDWKYIEVLENEAEPAQESPAPAPFAVVGGDFPALGAPAKAKKPPPGFRNEEANTRTPPGFAKLNKPPPPGFVSPPKSEPLLVGAASERNVPDSWETISFEYSKPDGFTGRNKQLIGAIQDILVEDQSRFIDFKTLSGEFRKAEITAAQYYHSCEDILGKEKFAEIFSELLALLPDIDKQHELMSVYMSEEGIQMDAKDSVLRISGKSKKTRGPWSSAQSGFLACPTCRQVLVRQDYNKHVELHNLDSDFPSLHTPGLSTQQLGLGAWVKAK